MMVTENRIQSPVHNTWRGVYNLRKILLTVSLLLTLCVPLFAQKNSGGQPYDKGAVIKSIKDGTKMSGFFVKVDAKKQTATFYTDKKLTDYAGEYNLGEQFWIDWDADKMDPLKIDIKAFYKKINLSKTILNRTQDGTSIANAKIIKATRPEVKPKVETAKAEEPKKESPRVAETPKTEPEKAETTKGEAKQKTASNVTNSTIARNTSNNYVPDAEVSENFVFTARKHPVVTFYRILDEKVNKIVCPPTMSIEEAAKKIVAPAKNDKEKARALYTWIAYNVVYDHDYKDESRTVASVWKNRIALCQGYTLLYIQMAKAVGLNAEYISGWGKDSVSYTPGDDLEKHGWGVVTIAGKPLLFDVTWGAIKGFDFPSTFNGDWFDCDPYLFAFSHYTEEEGKSFIADSITKEQFAALPNVDIRFTNLGIDGKELYDFFKVNPKSWIPEIYGSRLFNGYEYRINKLPFTDTLDSKQTYTFNFEFPETANEISFSGTILKSGTDLSFKPTASTSSANLNFNGYELLSYKINYHNDTVPSEYLSKKNLDKFEFTLFEGGKEDNIAHGKPKLLVFYKVNTGRNFYEWSGYLPNLLNDVDVVFVETGNATEDQVRNDSIPTWKGFCPWVKIAYSTNGKNAELLQRYSNTCGFKSSEPTIIVYIDSNNKFQYIEEFRFDPHNTNNNQIGMISWRLRDMAAKTKTKAPARILFNRPNPQFENLTLVTSGKKISGNASGKPKIIIYIDEVCGNLESTALLDRIISSSHKFKDIDVVILDPTDFESMRLEAHTRLGMAYNISSSAGEFVKSSFAHAEGIKEGSYLDEAACSRDPFIAYIDSNNRFRYIDTSWGITSDTILSTVKEIEATKDPVPVNEKVEFTLLNGSKSDNIAHGKPKILLFFNASDTRMHEKGRIGIYEIYKRYHLLSDVDFLMVETSGANKNTLSDLMKEIANYSSSTLSGANGDSLSDLVKEYENLPIAWATGNSNQNILKNYLKTWGCPAEDFNPLTMVYIDENNNLVDLDLYFVDIEMETILSKIKSLFPIVGKPKNKYGLPYDPDATIKQSLKEKKSSYGEYTLPSFGEYNVSMRYNEIWFSDSKNKTVATYDLINQAWRNRPSFYVPESYLLDFYSSIDRSKTIINRDIYGNSMCHDDEFDSQNQRTASIKTTTGLRLINQPNPVYTKFTLLDGTETDSVAHGKPKILIFFKTDSNTNPILKCRYITVSMANKYESIKDIDIIEVEVSNANKDAVIEYANHFDSSHKIPFAFSSKGDNNSTMLSYLKTANFNEDNAQVPIIVYIDANNNFQYLEADISVTEMLSHAKEIFFEPKWRQPIKENLLCSDGESCQLHQDQNLDSSVSSEQSEQTGPIITESGMRLLNYPNPVKSEFALLDGTKMDSVAQGKPKILIFFKTDCSRCRATTKSIATAYERFKDIDIIEVEINNATKEDVIEYANKFDSSHKIHFAFTTGKDNNSSMWRYLQSALFTGKSVQLPVIVYIDANNKFQYLENGKSFTANEILSHINEISVSKQ